MGSFPGHALPGTLFLCVGLWHIWCSVVRYVSNPETFRVRVWNPVSGLDGRLKYLELYLIAIGAFADMCIELLYSTHLKFFTNGILNPHHMNDFEHGGMLLMFFIYSVVILLSEQTRSVFFFIIIFKFLSLALLNIQIILNMYKRNLTTLCAFIILRGICEFRLDT